MNYEKFKFPDEQDGNIKQDQDDAAVKADAQDDVEVEIVDDTPPKDRGRKPLDKEVSDPTDDEIENYSANVQARIKELTHARHDERRRKEELEREKQEMERLLQYMADENKKLKQSVNQGHEIVLSSATEAAEAQLSAALQPTAKQRSTLRLIGLRKGKCARLRRECTSPHGSGKHEAQSEPCL